MNHLILNCVFFATPRRFAYGAVAYIVTDNNPNTPSFLMVKNRVVPRNAEAWSIPRKELIAVLEGARIAILSWKAFEGRTKNVTIWTDAATVLSWITNAAIRPNRFVRKRLGKLDILYHHFQPIHFEHVHTNLNLADVAS